MAAQLGGPMGDLLRSTARHAFVGGLHITLFVSAGLLLLGALAALRLPKVMDCPPKEACRRAEPDDAASTASPPTTSTPTTSASTASAYGADEHRVPGAARPSRAGSPGSAPGAARAARAWPR